MSEVFKECTFGNENTCTETEENDITESDKLILTEEGWQMIARYHFENVQLNATMGC